MRLAPALVSITCVASLAWAGSAIGGGNNPYKPSGVGGDGCHGRTIAGEGRELLRFRLACDFGVQQIRVDPTAPVGDFRRKPRIDRKVDPGDRVRCGRLSRSKGLVCRGTAGRRARVSGWLRPGRPACGMATRFRVLGGWDCDPPAKACPEVAAVDAFRDRRPGGC